MQYLKQFLIRHYGKLTLALILLTLQIVGTLTIPAMVADIVDHGILQRNLGVVYHTGVSMLIVTLLTSGIAAWGSWVTSDLSALFGYEMRSKILKKSQEISLQQFDDIGISSMITRTTSDIVSLQRTMSMMLQLAVPVPVIILASLTMTWRVHPWMAWIQILFMILLALFIIAIIKRSDPLSRSIQVRLDRINQQVREAVTGTRVIRAFGNEDYEEQRADKAYTDYAVTIIRLNRLFAWVSPGIWLLMGGLMAVILGAGGGLAMNGSIGIGQITAVAEYATLNLSYMMMGASVLTMLPKAGACLRRLQDLLQTSPAIVDCEVQEVVEKSGTPVIQFDHVTFAYPQAEEPVIHDLSFTLYPGQTLAVIGSTGSGKSTLADLMLRLHEIQEGRILFNNTDIRHFFQTLLRDRISVIPQKAFLFSGTLAENLRMGQKNAPDEVLWNALRIAQADDFVERLPRKLQTHVVQGGTNFSGGQRQRLAIARALVKPAEVIIFDDSFSALDGKTDAALRSALKTEVRQPAKLIITQRVSTILDADQILVLDKGRLVGQGTHAELIDTCSVYRDIVDSQRPKGGIHHE